MAIPGPNGSLDFEESSADVSPDGIIRVARKAGVLQQSINGAAYEDLGGGAGCVGEPRRGADLPDADITINPNGDKCSEYVLPAGTLTADRVLTIANAGGDNTKVCTIVVQDISAFTYTIQNSTPSTLFIKVASPGQAMTYRLLFSTNNIWNAYEHWWTD